MTQNSSATMTQSQQGPFKIIPLLGFCLGYKHHFLRVGFGLSATGLEFGFKGFIGSDL